MPLRYRSESCSIEDVIEGDQGEIDLPTSQPSARRIRHAATHRAGSFLTITLTILRRVGLTADPVRGGRLHAPTRYLAFFAG